MRWAALGLLFTVAASCNFDEAFSRYCKDNPQCAADAAVDAPAGGEGGRGRNDGGPFAIPLPTGCIPSSATPCPRANEICDPVAQICLPGCITQNDCPSYLDSCEPLDQSGATSTPTVCRCSSTQACINGGGTDYACHRNDRLCEHYCNGPQDCSGFQPQHRVCDRISRLCVDCLGNMDCPSPSTPVCDRASQRCTLCASNTDCANRPDGLTQCTSSGACAAP